MKTKRPQLNELISKKELSIRDFYFYIISKAKFIIILTSIFALIGIIKGLSSRDEFVATSKLLSEDNNLSMVSGLGGFLGSQLRQGNAANQFSIGPDLYPSIVGSDYFLSSLLSEEFYFENEGKEIPLLEFLTTYEQVDLITKTLELPKRLLRVFKKQNPESIQSRNIKNGGDTISDSTETTSYKNVKVYSALELSALKRLKDRITMTKSALLFEVTVQMPDPVVATQLNQLVIERLVSHIEKYQTEKERENFNFILKQKNESEQKYFKTQRAYVAFQDQNRGLISQRSKSIETQLQNNYNLAYSLYNQLAQQLDQARLKLQEAKPILTVFEPAVVPSSKSSPNIMNLFIVHGLVGTFIGIGFLFIQIFIVFFKTWLNEE